MKSVVAFLESDDGRQLVSDKCKAAGLDMEVLIRLIEAESKQAGKQRKGGLWSEFDEIFGALNSD